MALARLKASQPARPSLPSFAVQPFPTVSTTPAFHPDLSEPRLPVAPVQPIPLQTLPCPTERTTKPLSSFVRRISIQAMSSRSHAVISAPLLVESTNPLVSHLATTPDVTPSVHSRYPSSRSLSNLHQPHQTSTSESASTRHQPTPSNFAHNLITPSTVELTSERRRAQSHSQMIAGRTTRLAALERDTGRSSHHRIPSNATSVASSESHGQGCSVTHSCSSEDTAASSFELDHHQPLAADVAKPSESRPVSSLPSSRRSSTLPPARPPPSWAIPATPLGPSVRIVHNDALVARPAESQSSTGPVELPAATSCASAPPLRATLACPFPGINTSQSHATPPILSARLSLKLAGTLPRRSSDPPPSSFATPDHAHLKARRARRPTMLATLSESASPPPHATSTFDDVPHPMGSFPSERSTYRPGARRISLVDRVAPAPPPS